MLLYHIKEFSRNSQFGSFFDGALDRIEITGALSWEADIGENKKQFNALFQGKPIYRLSRTTAV